MKPLAHPHRYVEGPGLVPSLEKNRRWLENWGKRLVAYLEGVEAGAVTEISALSDVTITGTPADNELVAYDSGSGEWINQTAAEAGVAADDHDHDSDYLAATAALGDLSDVGTATPTARHAILGDGDSWESRAIVEADISDLDHYTSADFGNDLAAADLSDLGDVASGQSNGDLLQWVVEPDNNRWEPRTLAEAGVAAIGHGHTEADISDLGSYLESVALTDLTDVTVDGTPAAGELLKADGAGGWDNATLAEAGIAADTHDHDTDYADTSHTHVEADITDLGSYLESVAISDITDVTITTPADNEVLAYNGAGAWINQTAAEAGLAEASHSHSESDITDLGSYLESVALTDLTDVAIDGTPAAGEVIVADGADGWDNKTLAEAGIAAAGHGHTESDISDLDHDAVKIQGVGVDATVGSPSDGDIMVYRSAGSDWVLEAKPAGGSNPALGDVTDVTITSVAAGEVLVKSAGDWINQTLAEADIQSASGDAAAAVSAMGAKGAANPLNHDRYTDAEAVSATAGSYLAAGAALGDLSDVGTATPTAGHAILGDGDSWESRAIVEADISDLDHYTTSDFTGDLESASLSDLSDGPNGPSAGDLMMYQHSTPGWDPVTLAEAGVAADDHDHDADYEAAGAISTHAGNASAHHYKPVVYPQYDGTHTPSGTAAETVNTKVISNPGRAVAIQAWGMLQYDDNASNGNVMAWLDISKDGGSTWTAATNTAIGRAKIGTAATRWATVAYQSYMDSATPTGDIHVRLRIQVSATGGSVDDSMFMVRVE